MIRVMSPSAFRRSLVSDPSDDVSSAVAKIIADVRDRGDAALIACTEKFDGVKIRSVKAPRKVVRVAKRDMAFAYKRILAYHKEFADQSKIAEDGAGGKWGRIVRPIRRIGIYVPGGTAPLFSTLLMAAGAARAAGVKEIAVATPPPISDEIRAAAEIAGIDEIYQVGGAQAIAGLAYGTKSIKAVDKIVGPGNRYVAEAKRQVFGHVGIESIAGPSEILILSDGSSPAALIAADMIAQAEHDVWARSVVVVLSKDHAQEIDRAVVSQLENLPRRKIAENSLKNRGAIVLAKNLAEMIALANEMAPEHLELLVKNPWKIVDRITAAGAIFVGPYASEVLGDYVAGPNHILPTGSTARFASPLSARDFVTASSIQWFDAAAARRLSPVAARMARAEGLEGHARAAEIR